jgi:hypothetical protein
MNVSKNKIEKKEAGTFSRKPFIGQKCFEPLDRNLFQARQPNAWVANFQSQNLPRAMDLDNPKREFCMKYVVQALVICLLTFMRSLLS